MKKKFLIFSLLTCIMFLSLFLIGNYGTKKYKEEEEKHDLSHSTELAIVLVDEDGNETYSNSFPPSSSYYLDFAKSTCTEGSIIGWDTANKKIKITASKADKCKLYFKKGTASLIGTSILSAYGGSSSISTLTTVSGATADGEGGLYKATDTYGDSYYFRGDVTNNYVKFGKWSEDDTSGNAGKDMYWRILRINGDGTLRLIYDGTSAVDNGTSHTAYIAVTPFAKEVTADISSIWYYDDTNKENSKIKDVVDEWYKSNLNANYGTYIADSIFCMDREISSTSDTEVCYKGYDRASSGQIQLYCSQESDELSVSNGKLTYPVGMITVDEMTMSGDYMMAQASTNYLYDGRGFWAMTPYWHIGTDSYSDGYGIYVDSGGFMDYYEGVFANYGARPVINLRADLLFTGNGEKDTPYVVAGFE